MNRIFNTAGRPTASRTAVTIEGISNVPLEAPREARASAGWLQRVRPAAIVVHRWVGLAMAVFLTVAGITGSVLAFYGDLDAALNPELFKVQPPAPGAKLMDPIALVEKLRTQLPAGAVVQGAILNPKPDRALNFWIDERETFVDPYTAQVLGSRKFGDLSEGRKTLLTFLYEFHFSLGLGDVGVYLFGVVALLWTIDCFVGAYITFPPARVRKAAKGKGKSWLARWLPAWQLKTNTLFTLVFTWHRASGLWVWGMLLVFAWSAVALNLREPVYDPLMNVALGAAAEEHHEHLPVPRPEPKIDLRTALARGRSLMALAAEKHGFRVLQETGLNYDPEHGEYYYSVDSTLDIDARLADTHVTFDGDSGEAEPFVVPGGTPRRKFDQWLIALHFGAVRSLGLVYRSFVCVLGIGVALLSITGVWIWLRKRRKQPLDKSSGPARARSEQPS
jgi:uncharacterized iron-regulated membrane protein